MSEIRERLQEDLMSDAPWDGIRPHIARVIIVGELDLVDVGEALARDETDKVEAWLADGQLSRPSAEDLTRWERDQPVFDMVIVTPWILLRESGDEG